MLGYTAWERVQAEKNLSGTCTVLHSGTPVDDGMGGTTPGAVTETTYACRLGTGRGSERVRGGQTVATGEYPLYLPAAAIISVQDRVRIGTNTYEVIWCPEPMPDTVQRVAGLVDVDG